MSRYRIAIVALLCAMAVLASACGDVLSSPTPTPVPTRTPTPITTPVAGAENGAPQAPQDGIVPPVGGPITLVPEEVLAGFAQTPTPVAVSEADRARMEIHYEAGLNFQSEGRHDDAIAQFDEVLRVDPNFYRAYNDRGFSYMRLGQFERAIEDFDQAALVNPFSVSAYGNRSVANTMLGRESEASHDFELAVTLGIDREILERYITFEIDRVRAELGQQ